MDTTIRKANIEDITAIHNLVRELAIYEKAEPSLVATIEDYKRDFEAGWFECQVAETSDGQIIGIVIYYETFSTWRGRMLYLEDFVVNEAYRRYGVGQQLFDAYIAAAKEKNCTTVKWQIIDWNAPAIKFYVKNGATIEKEWWNGKIFLK